MTAQTPLQSQQESREQEFLRTHASVNFRRVDDIEKTVTLYTASGDELVTLPPYGEKTTWVPAGKYDMHVAENQRQRESGEFYVVDLVLQPGRHHEIQIGVSERSTRANAAGSTENRGLFGGMTNMVQTVGAALALVAFAVLTGSAGSIAIPPHEFIRGDDDEGDEQQQSEEGFSGN